MKTMQHGPEGGQRKVLDWAEVATRRGVCEGVWSVSEAPDVDEVTDAARDWGGGGEGFSAQGPAERMLTRGRNWERRHE